MIGTGILAMPIAYKNGGLWVSHGCYGYNKCGNIGQANFVCFPIARFYFQVLMWLVILWQIGPGYCFNQVLTQNVKLRKIMFVDVTFKPADHSMM